VSDEKIREFVDSLLSERANQIADQISSTENTIFAELEKIKKLNSRMDYRLPAGMTSSGDSAGLAGGLSLIHKYTMEISAATTQLKLIGLILEGVANFCSRAAIFLIRDDKLVGFEGKGFDRTESEISDREVKKIFVSLSANTTFKYVIKHDEAYRGDRYGHQDNSLIFDRFGKPMPREILVIPFFVKGKPQAVIYTDHVPDHGRFMADAIEIITKVGEMSLDLLPLKQKMKTRVKTQKLLEDEHTVEDTQPDSGITKETRQEEMDDLTSKQKKARRFARVTISDIILYNKDKVEKARKEKNIYAALKDTILQARESYLSKFNELEFFERELLNTLAEGDEEALKGYKFESI